MDQKGTTPATTSFDDIVAGIKALAFLGVAGWFAWGYFSDTKTTPPDQNPAMTLAEFKALNKDQRNAYVSAAISGLAASEPDTESFRRCMSDFAARKSETLLFAEVLGWCEKERQLNRPEFEAHFDELAYGDLSTTAKSLCEGAMSAQLVAPASAKFPFLDATIFHHDRQIYDVTSYVDSQNVFGAMMRTNFTCTIQFNGGDTHASSSWTTPEVTIIE